MTLSEAERAFPLPGGSWGPDYAAEVIGCTPDHVRDLCRRGQLTAVRRYRRWYIAPDSVRAYVARPRRRERRGG